VSTETVANTIARIMGRQGQRPRLAAKPITVSVRSAQEMLGLGHTRIYELIRDKKLDSVLIGKRRLIEVASIERLVEQSRQAA